MLTGTTTLTDVYQREGSRGGTMTFAVYETAFRNQEDELVCTARLTRIETDGAIGDSDGSKNNDTEVGNISDESESIGDGGEI